VTRRRIVIVVVGLAVVVGGLVLAVMTTGPTPYEPVAASVWSPPASLTLMKSDALMGNSCCDPNPGGRVLYFVNTQGQGLHAMIVTAVDSLQGDGWDGEHCADSPRWYCLTKGDLNAQVGPANSGPMGADLQVEFHRVLPGENAEN
jgi:hypothetical protein